MEKVGLKDVIAAIENEGFEYAFVHYDDFEEFKNK